MAKKLSDKQKIKALIDCLEIHLNRPDIDCGFIMNVLGEVTGKDYWALPIDSHGNKIMPWRKS